MTRSLCFLGLALLLGACGEDESTTIGFLQQCSSTPRTDCMGAAGLDCPNDDDCGDGMQCLALGARLVCTARCATELDCDALGESALCGSNGLCQSFCSKDADCAPFSMTCNGTSQRCQ